MQNYPVPLLNKELSGHSAEPVGRTCNEHPRHDLSPFFSKDAAKDFRDTGARSGGGIYPDQIRTPPFSSNTAQCGEAAKKSKRKAQKFSL
jgi:hypothetical protein